MKQNTYIAALLAGMLALAGCGGGSGSKSGTGNGQTLTPDEINQLEETARKESCTGTGLAYDESSKMCKADMSAADAAAKQASFVALYSALDKYSLATALNSYAEAKQQDDKAEISISMEGDEIGTAAIPLSTNVMPDYIEFNGVSDGGQETHKSTEVGGTNFEIAGKYREIAGKYKCVTSAKDSCMTNLMGDDKLDFTGGTWTFTADNGKDKYMDPDVLTYGWWTNTDSKGDFDAGLFLTAASSLSENNSYMDGGKQNIREMRLASMLLMMRISANSPQQQH